MVRNLTLSSRRKLPSGGYINITPESISLKETLDALDITQDQLILLAILIGTDFNPSGIKGIGPQKALKLVKENKSPETLFSKFETEFNWKEIFNLFKKMPVEKHYRLEWKKPDKDKIRELLLSHDFNEERVHSLIEKLTQHNKAKAQADLNKWF